MDAVDNLRSRKRVAAMRRIQAAALDLIEERGYAAVTVEEIAATAEVAPRSVYRYFGTKDAIVLWSDTDLLLLGQLFEDLPQLGLLPAFRRMADTVDDRLQGEALAIGVRQLRLANDIPELTAQLAVGVRAYAAALGMELARSEDRPPDDVECQVIAAAVMAGMSAALERWYLDGAHDPVGPRMHAALDAITSLGEAERA